MNERARELAGRTRARLPRVVLLAGGLAVCMVVGAAPAGAADAVTFAPQVNYPTGLFPWEVAAADFNGDGKQDVVAVNRQGDSVSVLLGNGNGTFQPGVEYPTGNTPFQAAVADLNADGKLDLAVARALHSTMSVLFGNGDGTFGAPTDYLTGAGPQLVAVADVDANGTPDLVSSNWEGDSVSVFLGSGDGTFGARTDFPTGNGPAGLAAADVNSDGRLDLVTANFFGDSVSVLLGNGDGTFGAPTNVATGDTADSLAIADLNADGKLDVVTGNHFQDTVSVLLGNGDGTFGVNTNFPTGFRSNDLAVLDINGDGVLDVVSGNWGPDERDPEPTDQGTISVLLGNGDGTLGVHTDFPVGPLTPAFDVADFNADGRPDLAVTSYDLHSVAILLNATGNHAPVAADESYTIARRQPLTVAAPGVLANDADSDGDALTAAVARAPGNGTLTLGTDGSFQYTPNKKFVGVETFTYTVHDGLATSAPATVTIRVFK